MPTTKYSALLKEQGKKCKGKPAKVAEKAKAYKADAIKKGKTAKEVDATIKRVTSSCSAVGAAKKRKRVAAKKK